MTPQELQQLSQYLQGSPGARYGGLQPQGAPGGVFASRGVDGTGEHQLSELITQRVREAIRERFADQLRELLADTVRTRVREALRFTLADDVRAALTEAQGGPAGFDLERAEARPRSAIGFVPRCVIA
jgi:hypothetical protein